MKDMSKKEEKISINELPMLFNSTVACKVLGICKRLFLEEVNAGNIRCIRKNDRLLFRKEYLDEYIEKLEKEQQS